VVNSRAERHDEEPRRDHQHADDDEEPVREEGVEEAGERASHGVGISTRGGSMGADRTARVGPKPARRERIRRGRAILRTGRIAGNRMGSLTCRIVVHLDGIRCQARFARHFAHATGT
jgi:hypothetical protein